MSWRVRVAALAWYVALSCCGMQDAGASDDALDALTERVERSTEETKEALQRRQDSMPRAVLLNMKETVDSFVSTVSFLAEIQDPDNRGGFSLFMHDYSEPESVRLLSSPDRTELDGFSRMQLQRDEYYEFSAVMRSHRSNGMLYPVCLGVRAWVAGDRIVVRMEWFEPSLAVADWDFPVRPVDKVLSWTPERWRIIDRDDREKVVERSVADKGRQFINPHFVYTLSDSFVALSCSTSRKVQRAVSQDTANAVEGPLVQCVQYMVGQSTTRQTYITEDKAGNVERVQIRQDPIRLVHGDPNAYQLREDIDGKMVSVEEFRPQTLVDYLEDGRDIAIRFRRDQDSQGADIVPFAIVISRTERAIWEAEITEIRRRKGPFPDEALVCARSQMLQEAQARLQEVALYLFEASRDNDTPPWEGRYYSTEDILKCPEIDTQRKLLAYNVYAAMATEDMAKLREALGAYRTIVLGTPLLDESVIAQSIESIVWYCFWLGRDDFAWEIMSGPLRECYGRMDLPQLRRSIGRLVSQVRYGAALIALDVYALACEVPPPWVEGLRWRLKSAVVNGFEPQDAILYPQLTRQVPIDRKIVERLEQLERSEGN
jgi:hypothetical protein